MNDKELRKIEDDIRHGLYPTPEEGGTLATALRQRQEELEQAREAASLWGQRGDWYRAEADRLRALAEWLVSLEDSEERRTVTLTKIIDRARESLHPQETKG